MGVMRLQARTIAALVALGVLAPLTACGPGTDTVTASQVEGVSLTRSTGERAAPPELTAKPLTVRRPAAVKPAARKVAAPRPVVRRPAAPKPVTSTTSTARATAATVSSYVTGCDATSGWQRRRGLYALRRISYNWKPLGYSIVFMAARRGITGMTYPAQHRIEVYVRSCSRMTTAYLAETIAHEIGHAVDFTRGTDAWHRKWQVARHISLSIPWYGAPYATDFSTPAGDFAETFGAWQVPDGPNDSKWGRPSRAQLILLIPLMRI